MGDEKLTTISRVWKTGKNNFVVTVPMNVMIARGWVKGDLIRVDWGEAIDVEPLDEEVKKELPEF